MAAPMPNTGNCCIYEISTAMQDNPSLPSGKTSLYFEHFEVDKDYAFTGWVLIYEHQQPLVPKWARTTHSPLMVSRGIIQGFTDWRWVGKNTRLMQIVQPTKETENLSPEDFVKEAMQRLEDEGYLVRPFANLKAQAPPAQKEGAGA
ncbi:hypothetical protein PWT90_02357 [Aphanocladium album]|nr:hypothetical protein PWT90_02357 [Aphanocladium album]